MTNHTCSDQCTPIVTDHTCSDQCTPIVSVHLETLFAHHYWCALHTLIFTVQDKNDSNDGDDSIFCDGICSAWIHRRCAGLSLPAFTKLLKDPNKDSKKFFCPHCHVILCRCKFSSYKASFIKILMSSNQESTVLPLTPCSFFLYSTKGCKF